jgi:hypothetical protein
MVNIRFIVIKLRSGLWRNLISILGCEGKYMSSPKRKDWLWTPFIFLAVRYRDVFLGSYSSRRVKLISHPCFVPSLRMSISVLRSSSVPSQCARRHQYFTTFGTCLDPPTRILMQANGPPLRQTYLTVHTTGLDIMHMAATQ